MSRPRSQNGAREGDAREEGAALSAGISRRPILDAGIALGAAVVVALIVLTSTRSLGVFTPPPNGDPTQEGLLAFGVEPWVSLARILITFCLPAIVCVVVIVMRDVELPRGVRYATFSLATIFATVVVTLAVLAAVGPVDAPSTIANDLRLEALADGGGLALTAAFGCCLGFSLPAVHKRDRVARRREPGRPSRRRVTFYVLLGLVIALVLWLVTAFGPLSDVRGEIGHWDGWFRDFVALPAVCYQTMTLAVAVLGHFINMRRLPTTPRRVMVALPLVAWAGIAIVGAVAGFSGLPTGFGWVVLIVGVFGGLGILPGIVIAAMRD